MRREVVRVFIGFAAPKAEFAPGCQHNERFVTQDRHQRLIASSEVKCECLVDPNHLIDPRFKVSRHAVIVHRRGNDDNGGPFDLIDQFVGFFDQGLFFWAPFLRVGEDGVNPVFRNQ